MKKILRTFLFSINFRKYVKPVNRPPDIDLRSGQSSSRVSWSCYWHCLEFTEYLV